jgi:hypothetical protein
VLTAGGRAATHIDGISGTTGQRRRVVDGGRRPIVSTTGHLLFLREGHVLAVPLDAQRLETRGQAVRVLRDVGLDRFGSPIMALSPLGSLFYLSNASATQRLVWVSRQGVEEPITDVIRRYNMPRLSGNRIAAEIDGDIWVHDIRQTTFVRLTSQQSLGNSFPEWFPNGRRLAFRTVLGLQLLGQLEVLARPHRAGAESSCFQRGRLATTLESDGQAALLPIRQQDDGGRRFSTSPDLKLSKPRVLFEQRYSYGSGQTNANYDVSPDGQRFVMAKDDSASGRLNIVLKWHDELTRLAPTDGR